MQFRGKELITFSYLNRNNYHLKIDKKKKRERKENYQSHLNHLPDCGNGNCLEN